MKKILFALTVVCLLLIFSVNSHATIILFSDDFTGTAIDYGNWSAVDNYGSVSQNDRAIFTFLGINAGNAGMHLESRTMAFPNNTQDVIFNGVWQVASSTYTAEPDIYIFNAANPSEYIRVGYRTWGADALIFTDTTLGSSIADYTTPDSHVNAIPFEFRLTDTGWSYSENGIILRNITSNFTQDLDNFYIKIGGWDYSAIPSQIAYFDDIKIEANLVPEPASLSLLGLGLLGFALKSPGRSRPKVTREVL